MRWDFDFPNLLFVLFQINERLIHVFKYFVNAFALNWTFFKIVGWILVFGHLGFELIAPQYLKIKLLLNQLHIIIIAYVLFLSV